MKVRKYGKGMKITTAIAEVVLVTLSVLCIGIVSCNAVISVPNRANTMRVNYYISPFSKTAAFADSDVFSDMVYDSLNDVTRFCVIRGQLESGGKFDETKEIDIEQFARHFEEVPVTDTSICYRLGDLLQWGQAQEEVSTRVYTYAQALEMIAEAREAALPETDTDAMANEDVILWEAGEAQAAGTDAETVSENVEEVDHIYYDYSQDGVQRSEGTLTVTFQSAQEQAEDTEEKQYVEIPVERYLPVDGRSILAHVDSVEELEEMVFYLKETVRMLEDNYQSYREYLAYFDKDETNFRYCVFRGSGKTREIYTNMPIDEKGTDVEEMDTMFAAMGRYLSYKPANFSYETDTSIREEQVRNIWNDYRYAYPDDSCVWIGVDTTFAYPDMFQDADACYRMAAPGYLFVILSIFCSIGAFILFGLMTHFAGRKQGTEGITLLWFDRWYTEIGGLVAFGITGTLFFVTGLAVTEFYWGAGDHLRMLVALALGTALTYGMFLFFWLSLVRRIKAGTFWKNFLLYHICVRLKDMILAIYDDGRNVVRVWVPYTLFVGANICLVAGDGIFFALFLDVFVGLFLYRGSQIRKKILEGIRSIRDGYLDTQIDVEKMHGDNRILAEAVNSIGNGIRQAVETSVRDERMKADLITNVSHDIKTPLTSIINYVDLIKREPVENEKIRSYLEVLDNKSQRLKQLTEDLVEVSRISSGNIVLQCEKLDLRELMNQTIGEFSEKLEEKGLKLILNLEDKPFFIYADSRRIWRVMENLFNNAYKYALKGTRVYVDLKELTEENGPGKVWLTIKNISEQPLRVGVEELTERFIRGDVSRTTEGSGLGLSIAKNLTELQKGKFEIISDGDLFKVVITFPIVQGTLS